jgi:hypothetical protein
MRYSSGQPRDRLSTWRSWHPDQSGFPSLHWTASCLCACDPAAPGPRPSASRCHFPWPCASASRDSPCRYRAERSCGVLRWLHLVMDFQRQAASSAAQPGMIRHSLALAKAQELAQRQAVRASPFQPALAVDTFRSSPSAAYGSNVPAAAMDDQGAAHTSTAHCVSADRSKPAAIRTPCSLS